MCMLGYKTCATAFFIIYLEAPQLTCVVFYNRDYEFILKRKHI